MVAQLAKNGNDNRHMERQLPDVREQVAAGTVGRTVGPAMVRRLIQWNGNCSTSCWP